MEVSDRVCRQCSRRDRPIARQDGGITLPFSVEKVETSAKNHQTHPDKERRLSTSGGTATPLSVTMPVTNSGGVTSNAGLSASTFRGATLLPATQRTSRWFRSSITTIEGSVTITLIRFPCSTAALTTARDVP